MENSIKKVAIIGLGALGSIYAKNILSNSHSIELYPVVRDTKLYDGDPIIINNQVLNCTYYTLNDIKDKMDLVIFALKYYDFHKRYRDIIHIIKEDSILMSLANGVLSEDDLITEYGSKRVVYSTVVGADVNRRGHNIIHNKSGILYFGEKENFTISDKIKKVESFMKACRISYNIPKDMIRELWYKLMINVGMNQVSTIYEYTYSQMRKDKNAMKMMNDAQMEVVDIANKLNINLSINDLHKWNNDLNSLSDNGRSSMLQDFWENRPLETDIFGDYICKMGIKLKIKTPINSMIREQLAAKENKK